jgi:hypothetical protein
MVTHTNILDISTTSIYTNNDITIYCVQQNDYPIDLPACISHEILFEVGLPIVNYNGDAYFMQLKHVAAITIAILKVVH